MADTIALMKQRVLDMAIRGELVDQRPEEGTAEELVQAAKHERESLMLTGEIKKEKTLPAIDDELSYDIPNGWRWERLGSITNFIDYRGKTPTKTENGIKLITAKNVRQGNISRHPEEFIDVNDYESWMTRGIPKKGDILFTTEAPLGYAAIVNIDEKFALAQRLICIQIFSKISSKFVCYMMQSQMFQSDILNKATGTTVTGIKAKELKKIPFPIPPLQEQYRIVAKIEEIFAVIDQIGERKEEALSIIRNMRQTALQDAIMGVLVDQDENDEPASVLYEKIQAEKEQMMKEKKINKEKPLPAIEKDEIPFEIPESWKWIKMGSLANKVHYGYTASAAEEGNAKMLRITDIQNGRVNWDSVPYCKIEQNKIEQYKLSDSDIVIARTGGTVGKSFKINKAIMAASVFASYLIRIVLTKSDTANYIAYFLNSPYYWEQIGINAQGTGQPNVNATQLSNLTLPFPPLAEQERIVDKLDGIMAICDQMEAIFDGTSEVSEDLKVV